MATFFEGDVGIGGDDGDASQLVTSDEFATEFTDNTEK
jgi:hypothetical protein